VQRDAGVHQQVAVTRQRTAATGEEEDGAGAG